VVRAVNVLSIRDKFLLIWMCITILSTSVIGGVLVYYEHKNAENYQIDKLNLVVSVISPSLTAAVVFDDAETIEELIFPIVKTEGVVGVAVFDANQELISDVFKEEELRRLSIILPKFESALTLQKNNVGKLVLYTDDSIVENKVIFYQKFLAQVLLWSIIASLLFAWLLSHYITKPLSKLTSIAKSISVQSNYSIRAQKNSSDEIGDLTDCFNLMLETIELRDRKLESKVASRTQDLEVAMKKLHHQAHEDALSGLPNRRSLMVKLDQLITEQQPFCVLFIDLDGFKVINDSFGHYFGDQLLKEVSERLVASVKKDDFVARLGGDEFTIILKDIQTEERINNICHHILHTLSAPFTLKNEQAFVSGSMGITLYPHDSDSVETLVRNADQAMYESKRQGKNCYHYFTQDIQNKLSERKTLVDDLRNALKNQEFYLVYQPVFNLHSGEVLKAEALVRWHHPSKGILYPGDFIEVMEEEGLMDEFGFWIASSATKDATRWRQQYNKKMQVSINVSPSQFAKRNGKLQIWLEQIRNLDTDCSHIIVEITEHSIMENNAYVQSVINDMRSLGIKIAVDDFGMGYSSFSYLQELELDILKIDKSFIDNLTESSNGYALCRAIIRIAHELELVVIAEGIETEKQKNMLIRAGCDFGQGFIFSKALTCNEFEEMYFSTVIA